MPGLKSLVLTAMFLAGCSGPVVRVRHDLPPDVPLRSEKIVIGTFEVNGGSSNANDLGKFVADHTRRCLSEASVAVLPAGEGSADAARLDAQVQVVCCDMPDTRSVRRMNPQGELQTRQIETLRRQCRARVLFMLHRPNQDAPMRIETRASYDSASDPRTLCPTGVCRGDAPQMIPPAEQIMESLLVKCSDDFCQIVAPMTMSIDMPLRWSSNAAARRGGEAAAEGDYVSAASLLGEAARQRPGDAAIAFNLAVVLEAGGKIDDALTHYRRALQFDPQNAAAQNAAERVESLVARREYVSRLPSLEEPVLWPQQQPTSPQSH